MSYALSNLLINNQKVYRYYLFLTNINSKFLFALPIKNNTTPSIEITKILIKNVNDFLGSLGDNLKINNIRAYGDSKFGKMIEDNDRIETVKLVDDFSNTPHRAFYHMFTPFQVQLTRDLERYFIKENEYK
jgi:hypothetical protein